MPDKSMDPDIRLAGGNALEDRRRYRERQQIFGIRPR